MNKVEPPDADYGSIGQRLKVVRTKFGKEPPEMAEAAGIPLSSYLKYESDSSSPGSRALRGLGLMGIDLVWLLSGKGGDELGAMRAHGVSLTQQIHAKYDATEAFALVPVYDIRAAAGHGALAEDRPPSEHWAFSRVWLEREVRVPPSRLLLVTVVGNSGEPDVYDGDVVMVDRGDIDLIREGLYVFYLDGHIYMKKLELRGDQLVIASRNHERYPPNLLSTVQENSTFRLLARVIGKPMFKHL